MQQLISTYKLSSLFATILALLLLSLSSCTELPDDIAHNDDHLTKPICTENSQCPQHQICRRNYCTIEDTTPVNIGLTFIPPNSTNYLPQRIQPFAVNPNISLQIGLEASILVRGQLNFQDRTLPGPSGLISVQRNDDPSGFHRQQTRVETGHFEIFLLPGQYTLSLTPDEASIPSFIWQNEVFTSDTEFKRTLPNPLSTLSVQGNISFQSLNQNSGSETPEDLPVPQSRVMAISKTGLFSTITTTNESGHYILKVWPHTGSYDLHISPIHANSLTPSVVFRDAFTANDQTVLSPQTLGAYRSTTIPTQIRLEPQQADPNPNLDEAPVLDWSQTSALLHANIGQGLIKLTPQISANGYIDLPVIEGQYTIEIIPPLDSHYARTSTMHEISSSNSVLNIKIPLKKNIHGTIYDSEGNALENVKVKLTPYTAEKSASRSISEARTMTVTTNDSGQFNAWIENSTYQLSIIPLTNSGLPRTFTTIQADDPDLDTNNLVITIPKPVIIYGTLYEEDGMQAMSNVSIQAFNIIDDQQHVIAEALTNARGEFLLITSNELNQSARQQPTKPQINPRPKH